ncbi:MAG: leucine-rich repeat domain-containing protein [Lachnospiraceae bacterium]|nr:leucine-rich repeat domain-containing protein [Lachnospiraceae bacterium]
MKHLSISIIIFLSALAFASCSSEDMPAGAQNGLVTIEASIDRAMISRASVDDTDETPTRANLYYKESSASPLLDASWTERSMKQSGDKYTLDIELDKNKTYDIVVWADNDGLNKFWPCRSHSVVQKKSSIAFCGRILNFKPSESAATVVLKHVVAKLVVNETGTLNTGDKVKVSFYNKRYNYNPYDGSYTLDSEAEEPVIMEKTVTETANRTGNLFTYYYLVPPADSDVAEPQEVTLSYYRADKDRNCEKVISNVPFHANRRTVITGSFRNLDQYADLSFSVTTDDNWAEGTVEKFPLSYTKGEDGDISEFLERKIGTQQNLTLPVYGEMTLEDLNAFRDFLKSDALGKDAQLTLDFSNATFAGNEVPNRAFDGGDKYSSETNISGLKAIVLPESVTKIAASSAFRSCVNLESINLDKLVMIAPFSFQYCSKLNSIDLSNCNEIYDYAFQNCTSLSDVIYPIVDCNIGSRAFSYTALSGAIVLGDNITLKGNGSAFGWNSAITSINVMAPIDGTQAFSSLYHAREIIIRGEKVNFGKRCFFNCSDLEVIDLSESSGLPEWKATAEEVFEGIINKTPDKIAKMTVYVKNSEMQEAFAADENWISAGFKPEQFVVKE